METVTIPKKEYERLLKKAGEIDADLAQLEQSLEDIKHGRIIRR